MPMIEMRHLTIGLVALVSTAAAAAPTPATLQVRATAYCQGGKTKSGMPARAGIVAADPAVLPVGTVIQILDGPSSGIYTVMDTGAAVKGRRIDIFIADCARAEKFGAQSLRVRVLRRGWDPKDTPPPATTVRR
jgi:3D (Asp-Asp-Asp) domain-containing protein